MRTEGGGYRRDYLRALAQRVEVDAKELRIMGSKSELLRTLVAASSAKTASFGVPSSVPKWRAAGDSFVDLTTTAPTPAFSARRAPSASIICSAEPAINGFFKSIPPTDVIRPLLISPPDQHADTRARTCAAWPFRTS
jgi:hypothetical protein